MVGRQCSGNLFCTVTIQRHAVDPSDYKGRFLVNNPAFGVQGVFFIPIRRLSHRFASISFDLVTDSPLLADITRIPLVEQIAYWGKFGNGLSSPLFTKLLKTKNTSRNISCELLDRHISFQAIINISLKTSK